MQKQVQKLIIPNTTSTSPTDPKQYISQALLDSGFKDWQIILAGYMAMPKAYRPSYTKICGELGITKGQYYFWHKHPKLIDLKIKLTKFWFVDQVPDVLEALRVSALQGDTHAARTFLEYVTEWIAEDSGNKRPAQITNIEVKNFIINLKAKEKTYDQSEPSKSNTTKPAV